MATVSADHSQSAWDGRVRLGLGWGLFSGTAGDNSPHAHHAVQIVLSASPQRLWTAAHDWQSCRGAVIGADVRHRLADSTEPVTLLYLEPDSPEGRRAASSALSGFCALSDRQVLSGLAAAQAGAAHPAREIVNALFSMTNPEASSRGDALIEAFIAGLSQAVPERLGIAALATQAGVSPSRLQHRFRAHTGMALRPYLRWRRLLLAMAAVRQGKPLTDAAFEAGFADAAHFSRTFQRHFGIAPRVLLQLRRSLGQL